MDERRLPQTVDGVLERGERDGGVVEVAVAHLPLPVRSEQFVNCHAFRRRLVVYGYAIIGEAARRRHVVEPLVADGIDLARH